MTNNISLGFVRAQPDLSNIQKELENTSIIFQWQSLLISCNCELIPDNVSTDTQSVFISQSVHILHLGISKHIKECIVPNLVTEDILSHTGSDVGKEIVALVQDAYFECVQQPVGRN